MAREGKDALEKLRTESVDLIISDILMPVMDGFQLCQEVKTNDKLKNIPFIFYTATYTDKKDEELALMLGASKFIRKPVERDELIKIIQCLIRDVEERKIEPKKIIFGKEKEIFKLYSERLVNKLEKKMLALEKEVTKRKRVEEQIKASLREKEVLLQEIHHRVKNNMQIISSLIKLQTKQIKDEKALETLKSTQNRVHSMAAIHDRLYQSKNFARVDFGEYVQSLTVHLFSVYRIDPKAIKLNKKIKDVFLHVNSAIPCGLIINELVSNSLKHAFPAGKKGEIKIFMHHLNKNEIELIVSDNGIGLPKGMDFRDPDSLGLHLVTILAEDQLHGDIKLDRTKGTGFHIRLDVKQ
jgi:two-component sensor histidine kinase